MKASGFLVLLKVLLKDPTLANEDTRKLLYLEKFRILNEKKIEKGYLPASNSNILAMTISYAKMEGKYVTADREVKYFTCKNGGKVSSADTGNREYFICKNGGKVKYSTFFHK